MKAKCPDCKRPFKSEHAVKIHMNHCKGAPAVDDKTPPVDALAPPVLEPVIIHPIVMPRVSDVIKQVKRLAKEVGSVEELKAICDSL